MTDIRKHAYIIGKDLENFSNSFPIPKDIEVKTLNLSGKLHISYYLLSIAREIVDKSPDADQIQDLVAYSAECIEETIADIEAYIYKCSMKSKAEIQNYLARYEEITEQDSLNYSISEDFNMISNLMSTQSKMSEWISEKMKNSNISDSSSIILFDVTRNGNNKANPFDLASSLEDKSSLQCPTVSVEEMIDSAFVNSLIEMGNKKRTIIIQVEDRRESCQCSVCPLM